MSRQTLTSALGLLVLVSMVLAACGQATPTEAPGAVPATAEGPAPTEAPAEPKIATGAWSQEPDNVVPYYTQMSYAWWIAQLTLVGLAEWDDKGNYVPELAAEIPSVENGGVSADGLTITWKLKEGLLWSDGEPLTSADVKFTWESIVDLGNAALTRGSYSHIDSVETPDDTTVVLKFKEVYPPWQVLFAGGPNTAGSILPKHILEGRTGLETDPFIHWPTVANGPFVISEWVAGDHMTLVRNDNFYGSRPKLDQIFIRFVPTPETALAALQTGDVDWYPDFSESDISTLAALEPAVHLLVVPGSEFEHYLFNMGVKAGVVGSDGAVIPGSQSPEDGFCPFKDYNVRKAIILGINRQAIVDALLEGKTTVAASQWPNSFWENSSLTAEAYDPEQAKALLEEAGYTDADGDGIREGTCDGQPVKLEFTFQTTDKQIRVDIALAAQSDLSKIGIKFNPIHMPAGTFFGTYTDGGPMSTGKFDMAGYTTGFYPDPYPVTEDWLCRSIPNAENPGGANWYQYCSPELDALFADLNSSADPAARKVAVDAIQKYIYDNALVVMMYTRANVYGYVDRFVPGPFSFTSNMNWNAEVWDVK